MQVIIRRSVGNTAALPPDICKPNGLKRQAAIHDALPEWTANLIPALDGSRVVTKEGMDYLLMEKVNGEPFDAAQALRDPHSAFSLGEGLAGLHEALGKCDPILCVQEDLMKKLREWDVPEVQKSM